MATAGKASVLYDTPEAVHLVKRMQAGDELAFNQLYAAHYNRILTVIHKYIEEKDIAEAIANGVFARVWEVRGKKSCFKSRSSFTTWLTRIAINECLMYLRSTKQERKRIIGIDALTAPENETENFPIELGVRDVNLEGMIDRKILERGIQSLSVNYRTVLVLRLVEGLSTEETCSSLGLEVTVVKSRLFRARIMLREWLRDKKFLLPE